MTPEEKIEEILYKMICDIADLVHKMQTKKWPPDAGVKFCLAFIDECWIEVEVFEDGHYCPIILPSHGCDGDPPATHWVPLPEIER